MVDENPQNMSKEEQIGYHKGSLAVLSKEREEMARILAIVEQLMQMHIKALGDLGVDLPQQDLPTADTKPADKKEQKPKVPIEHLL